MNIIIFIIILVILVVSHEFGHFIAAKKSGIRVDEFSFGFPPKIFSKKIGETTYNFNLLPLGGYVKIFGENGETESKLSEKDKEGETTTETTEEDKNKSRSFINKPRYIQALVLVSGVLMNFLVAWILLSVGFISGLPTSVGNVPQGYSVKDQAITVTGTMPGSPAEKSGILPGDKILSLDTSTSTTKLISPNFSITDVQQFVKSNTGKEINISIERGKEYTNVRVVPEVDPKGDSAMIGISMDNIGTLKLPIHKAIWQGLKLTLDVTYATMKGFYSLIHDAFLGKADISNLTGPVGIVGVVGDAAKFGFIYLLSLTAFISINLAVINLIPFPALDGGRLLFLLIERIKGSRIKPEVANWVNAIGFGLLMILMVFITYHDIIKLL